jgi:hypothetical protein
MLRTVDVITAARADGVDLDEKPFAGQWFNAWRRGDDERWPCFLTEREALDYMADRLQRGAFFG